MGVEWVIGGVFVVVGIAYFGVRTLVSRMDESEED